MDMVALTEVNRKHFDLDSMVADNTRYNEPTGDFFIGRDDLRLLDQLVSECHAALYANSDFETLDHTAGESRLVQMIAGNILHGQFHLTPLERLKLHYAVMLHDVGKARIPNSVLKKEGELTDAEWHIMRQHVGNSVDMITQSDHFKQLSDAAKQLVGIPMVDIIAKHHWFVDLSGYGPKGFRPRTVLDIPFGSQIMHAADAISACNQRRGHHGLRGGKPQRTAEEAKHMVGSLAGKQFSRIVASAVQDLEFLPMFSMYAQLPTIDNEYLTMLKGAMVAAALVTHPSDRPIIEQRFANRQQTRYGAPLQVGYMSPIFAGDMGDVSVLEREERWMGTAQDQTRPYGIELLADGKLTNGKYEKIIVSLFKRIAQKEGFANGRTAANIDRVFTQILPHQLERAYAMANGGRNVPKDIGHTFNVLYQPERGELSIIVRNPIFEYVNMDAVLGPLQNHIAPIPYSVVRRPEQGGKQQNLLEFAFAQAS